MKIQNQISSYVRRFSAACLALAALSISTQPLQAGTSWTGGGGADTTVTNDLNWGGTVNSLNGTTAASFNNASNLCTLNTNAYFTAVTFSPQSAAGGFTIAGPSNLIVKGSASGGTKNIIVSNGSLGNATNNAPLQVNTSSSLLVMQVNKAVTLAINNGISASSGTYTLRHEGVVGSTARIAGSITGLAGIQMASGTWAGDLIVAGNQSLGSADVTINNSTGYGVPALTARLIFGESLSDLQSWRNFSLNRFMDVVINGSVTAGSFSVQSNAIVEVPGSLMATALTLGSAGQTGNLKVSGTAYFSGAVTIGSTVGNTIVGNSASVGTLALSSGTLNGNVTIGGANPNENNLSLVKTNSATLTLGGAHTYTGNTVVQAGLLDLTGSIVSSVTVSNAASLGGEGSTTGGVIFSPGTENFYFDPTTGGAFTANTINASGATVIVNPSSSAAGVVMQSTTTPNGITGTVGVNFVSGARGNLSLNGTADTLSFTPTSATNLVWKGSAANSTFWDVITTTNWNNGTERFYSSDNVRFDDSASSFSVAVQGTSVSPGSTVISNNVNLYTLSGGSITGTGLVKKSGAGTLNITSGGHNFTGGLTVNAGTLNLWSPVANSFTGGVTNNGGTLVISNMNQIAATTTTAPNAINLNGGALSYTGPTFSQTTDTLLLNLLGGVSTIEVTSTNSVTLRVGTAVTGVGDLIKSGPGTLALGKNTVQAPLGNTFTGKILVTEGQLDIRQSDSLGSINGITEFTNATLYLDPFGQTNGMTFNPEPLVFSGNSFIRNFNQSATVSQTNVLTGPITNNGTLGIFSQTNGGYGELQITGDITNGFGSSLNFGANNANVPLSQNQIVTVTGNISGPASVTAQGGNGAIYTLANNNYTGNTTVSSGTLVLQQATLATNSSVTIAANGVLKLDFGVVTNTISTLTLNGVGQNPGTYDAVSAAPYITGAGTLLVTSSPIASYPTNITVTVSGSTLTLTWPATHLGWFLQSQTNSLSVGLTTPTNTWFDVVGSDTATSNNIAINPANPSVFYRLRHP